jgi:hypothetical protein
LRSASSGFALSSAASLEKVVFAAGFSSSPSGRTRIALTV